MIIGVDIGGTKVAAAGFTMSGDTQLEMAATVRTAPTPATAGGAAVVRVVADLIAGLCDMTEVTAFGVGTAGVVDADGGISSATDAIADWSGFPLRSALADAVGMNVSVLNDVHAAAVAEATLGAASGVGSMLMAAVGTGVGGAVVLRDGVRRGVTGTAGSLGHVDVSMHESLAARRCPCGGHGHVEAVASGPAMELTYFEEAGVRASLQEIDRFAQRGDTLAAAVIAQGARYLGRALASANALLDVDTIVVGGGVAEIGERYLADIASSYRDAALPGPARARVVAAELGTNAALKGAAINAVCS